MSNNDEIVNIAKEIIERTVHLKDHEMIQYPIGDLRHLIQKIERLEKDV